MSNSTSEQASSLQSSAELRKPKLNLGCWQAAIAKLMVRSTNSSSGNTRVKAKKTPVNTWSRGCCRNSDRYCNPSAVETTDKSKSFPWRIKLLQKVPPGPHVTQQAWRHCTSHARCSSTPGETDASRGARGGGEERGERGGEKAERATKRKLPHPFPSVLSLLQAIAMASPCESPHAVRICRATAACAVRAPGQHHPWRCTECPSCQSSTSSSLRAACSSCTPV